MDVDFRAIDTLLIFGECGRDTILMNKMSMQ